MILSFDFIALGWINSFIPTLFLLYRNLSYYPYRELHQTGNSIADYTPRSHGIEKTQCFTPQSKYQRFLESRRGSWEKTDANNRYALELRPKVEEDWRLYRIGWRPNRWVGDWVAFWLWATGWLMLRHRYAHRGSKFSCDNTIAFSAFSQDMFYWLYGLEILA